VESEQIKKWKKIELGEVDKDNEIIELKRQLEQEKLVKEEIQNQFKLLKADYERDKLGIQKQEIKILYRKFI